jgi:6-phosphogluconolactonase
MLPEIVVGDVEALARRMAEVLEADGREALRLRGRFSLALSGGSVASAFFPVLARDKSLWFRSDFFWCDERAVPPSHPDSNYAAAHSFWLEPAGVPAARIHRMPADAVDLPEAAAAYEAELVRVLGAPPRLDIVLLGVGPDGHVASLFPGHAALAEEHRSVLAIEDSPKPPPRRLTLTLPVLAGAERVVVAATGKAKAEILREALEDPSSALPLARVLNRARRALVLLDADAASGVQVSSPMRIS